MKTVQMFISSIISTGPLPKWTKTSTEVFPDEIRPFYSKGFRSFFSGERNESVLFRTPDFERLKCSKSSDSSEIGRDALGGLCDPVEFEGIGKEGAERRAERRGLSSVFPIARSAVVFCGDFDP
ncbi:hypothetical protein NPIL_642761 [Nephila pilipes]|uniref:Uncharacterized protein n=1 Tax=Nephila pilipes TaxID=299642 RepID=A0A8X6NUU9_NEPPI|nr:hypothetical protein NPIL_642761 [Nephila pilipes]